MSAESKAISPESMYTMDANRINYHLLGYSSRLKPYRI